MKRICKSGLKNIKFLVLFPLIIIFFASYSRAQLISLKQSTFQVDVQENIQRLIEEEDTDWDKKITIDDHFMQSERGDKKFWLTDENNRRFEITGTYYLSNLLQELKLYQENGNRTAQLTIERIFENPVKRISRCIREIYWNGLTRRIDEENIVPLFTDSKTTTIDGFRYIYVPFHDEVAYDYFSKVSLKYPELKIKVFRLPEVVTPQWVKGRTGYHGILSLALIRSPDGRWEGIPFVVPGGRFNEMYGWDSYFEALGLLVDGRIDLAKAMVDNFVYEITYYGKILNANRSYYLTRSQPPFLTSMALAVYEHLPRDPTSKEWLRRVFQAAIKEYREVWMGKDRLTKIGLSRYYGEGIGPPPEVEPGHFDVVYKPYAKNFDMPAAEFEKSLKKGEIAVPELDAFFTHDRSMRESGHDKTYRWDDRCADFVTVDLNSLLYKIELDIARTIKREFSDSLMLKNGKVEKSSAWYMQAEKRKKLMNKYLWDPEYGLFLDYDLVNKCRKKYINAVVFYPLWAELASKKQAEAIIRAAIPALEMPGGLVVSTEESRGNLLENRPARQWDYPNGWAPHQMLAWQGLINYDFDDIASRLIYRWLYTIIRNSTDYNGTIPEKFDVVNRSHHVFAEYGNVGTKFAYITREGFGWMNASYQVGLNLLPTDLQRKLEQLIPPEWTFGQ
ncbi:MAG: trehalase family glycosidase [bacterium]